MMGMGSLLLEVDRVGGKGPGSHALDPESVARAIAEEAESTEVGAVLLGETRFGTVVAAKLAAKLEVGSLGRGRGLKAEGGWLSITRDVYGGLFAAQVSARLPCVALVQPGGYLPLGTGVGTVKRLEVARSSAGVSVLEERPAKKSLLDIKSAKIVVSAGRGFAKKEDLVLAQQLADALGAALGCSRPLTSERGWMGEDQQIGLTGAYVRPDLYIAVGISGQLQHLAGVKDSKLIVAINKDRQAPIFQSSDYGVVGDLYEVLPAFTKALLG